MASAEELQAELTRRFNGEAWHIPGQPDPRGDSPYRYSPAGTPQQRAEWYAAHERWLRDKVAKLREQVADGPVEHVLHGADTAIIRPGDTLIVRFLAKDVDPASRQKYEDILTEHLGIPVKVVIGEQMAIVRP